MIFPNNVLKAAICLLILFFPLHLSSMETRDDSSDNYSRESKKLELLKSKLQKLIAESEELLSSNTELKKEHHTPATEPIQNERHPEIDPPVHQEGPEPFAKQLDTEYSQPYSIPVPPQETPWYTDLVYHHAPAPPVCDHAVPCDPEPSCCRPCANNPCGLQDFLFYIEDRWGERPDFDGTIHQIGGMFFGNSLKNNRLILFADLSWSSFKDCNNGFSGGFGIRLPSCFQSAYFGINAYFDYFDFSPSTFRQASVGLEWLTCSYSIRANGYFPVGRKYSHPDHIVYDDYIGDYIVEVDDYFRSLKGYDIELRKHFSFPCNLWVFPSIGAYYLDRSFCSKWGGKAGLTLEWSQLISVEGNIYYDKCHHTKGEGRLRITIPLEMICNPCWKRFCYNPARERVRRRNYIPYEEVCDYTTNY